MIPKANNLITRNLCDVRRDARRYPDAIIELGVSVSIQFNSMPNQDTVGVGAGSLGLGLLSMKYRTRSRVAIESSRELCPTVPPPVWIVTPRCSFDLSGSVSIEAEKSDVDM